ncbi:MAG: EAL domain-containing protein, partial [Burkholderiales bacterium]
SSHQLRNGRLASAVKEVIEVTGVTPESVSIELTESVLIENAAGNVETLKALKSIGIKLSMDDFGTGYSSLTYLKRLPVDALKIDKSFVRDATSDPNDAEIIRAIVAMALSLDLAVIAEGVETPEQLEFLQGLGCHLYQGYLHSRPLPLKEFKKLLK